MKNIKYEIQSNEDENIYSSIEYTEETGEIKLTIVDGSSESEDDDLDIQTLYFQHFLNEIEMEQAKDAFYSRNFDGVILFNSRFVEENLRTLKNMNEQLIYEIEEEQQ